MRDTLQSAFLLRFLNTSMCERQLKLLLRYIIIYKLGISLVKSVLFKIRWTINGNNLTKKIKNWRGNDDELLSAKITLDVRSE